jgi:hypothetical protein
MLKPGGGPVTVESRPNEAMGNGPLERARVKPVGLASR